MAERAYSRRQALAGATTVGLGALLAACGADQVSTGTEVEVPTGDGGTATVEPRGGSSASALFDDTSACSLTPEMTAGPYYFDVDKVRGDVREDREGATLRLAIRVRDAECEPLPNAVVEIWHCDAQGLYSGFEAASRGGGEQRDEETYLRGAQVTGADGIVEFATIYPGWYRGRTTHIHAMVHLDRTSALTTQIYFDESVTAKVYEGAAYARDSERGTFNENDGIFDAATLIAPAEQGGEYLSAISFDVRA